MSNEEISSSTDASPKREEQELIVSSSDDCLIPSLRFPQKLWRIVNECKSGAIGWGSSGQTVVIDYTRFQEEYLQSNNSIFKTTNLASFIRQLNLYGFRKVTLHNRDVFGAPIVQQTQDVHEFSHEHFKIGRLDLLSRVCRKTGVKKNAKLAATGQASLRNGMTKLQLCQIALTKALEQATRQYKKERFWHQISNENVPEDPLKPKCKIENLESNIQIIFQDLSGAQEIIDVPILDASGQDSILESQVTSEWRNYIISTTDYSNPASTSF